MNSQQSANIFYREQELKLSLVIKLPFPYESALTALQHCLQNQKNQTKLSVYLRGIGGSDLKDCVNRILERLISPALARRVNFSGLNKKICFKMHHLRSCLIGDTKFQN
ncbi:unnamed protein product [Allacma fusca]|uniref:Uncharacterized protein n=1 Tax=Allacma fusca TaxID=39272 RepID=A0A8J2KPZ4_9HEXA|nr:unnamed protein product [Allacma fusca]